LIGHLCQSRSHQIHLIDGVEVTNLDPREHVGRGFRVYPPDRPVKTPRSSVFRSAIVSFL
jgi:hypothetical protein